MTNCPFCSPTIKKFVIWQNAKFIAILPNRQVGPSHILIVPKKHTSRLSKKLIGDLSSVCLSLASRLKMKSFTLKINHKNDPDNKLHVSHTHMHFLRIPNSAPPPLTNPQILLFRVKKFRKSLENFLMLE